MRKRLIDMTPKRPEGNWITRVLDKIFPEAPTAAAPPDPEKVARYFREADAIAEAIAADGNENGAKDFQSCVHAPQSSSTEYLGELRECVKRVKAKPLSPPSNALLKAFERNYL